MTIETGKRQVLVDSVLDFPSVGANDSEALTVAVAQARLGQAVHVTPANNVAATASQGTLTMDTVPTDGDTVTIGTKVYTFQTALLVGDGNVAVADALRHRLDPARRGRHRAQQGRSPRASAIEEAARGRHRRLVGAELEVAGVGGQPDADRHVVGVEGVVHGPHPDEQVVRAFGGREGKGGGLRRYEGAQPEDGE